MNFILKSEANGPTAWDGYVVVTSPVWRTGEKEPVELVEKLELYKNKKK